MDMVHNSEHYSILAYPAQQGIELVDKESNPTLFIFRASGFRFRQTIDSIQKTSVMRKPSTIFLDEYCEGYPGPSRFH